MIGNSSFGFSSSGGGGGGGTIGGGGTLNYLAKFTPDGTHIGDSRVYDDGTTVMIGTTSGVSSAAFNVESTTQGFLFPRMTTIERDAIASPATGLWIYNTSSSFFNYWDGSAWIQVDTSTGGDVSGSGTTNYAMMWTDGINSVAGDGTWMFSANDYLPVTTGSNIGDATHRIGTIFMASVFDYSGTLNWYNGTSNTMTLTNTGNLGIGTLSAAVTKLEVAANNATAIIVSKRFSNDTSPAGFAGGKARGTQLVPLAVQTDDEMSSFAGAGYYTDAGGGFSNATGAAIFVAAENFTSTSQGTYFKIGTTAIGSTTKLDRFWITSEGDAGFGISNPSAKVQIIGTTNDLSAYSLKIDNSTSTSLLYVRNDGIIEAGSQSGITQGSLSFGFGSGNFVDLNNTFIGVASGHNIQNGGNRNVAIGSNSMYSSTTASRNVAIGDSAMINLTTGFGNIAVGWASASTITNGLYNTVVGFSALSSATSGVSSITAIGYNTLSSFNSAGDINEAIGYNVLAALTSGNGNIGIGSNSLDHVQTGQNNIGIGQAAGRFLDTNSSNNTFIGYYAGYGNSAYTGQQNVSIGSQTSFNSKGSYNTVLGTFAGLNNDGSSNVFLGFSSGRNQTAASNLLIIDNDDRGSIANEVAKSLVYGIFDANQANQLLRFNAGHINMSTLPVGNGTVSSGELYVDTAANILSNGDLVVGIKQ